MTKGWETRCLGDVCDLATGGTPSRARPDFFGGEIPWLVSGDINQREISECEGRITVAGMQSCNTKILPKDSVMIALNGQGKTRATVAMLRMEGATCNQSLVSISPKNRSLLIPEFVYSSLHGRYEELRRLTSDDDKDRRGLNMGIIRNIRIPFPPVEEQRRIVALLDEAFAGIATAKASAERNLRNAGDLFDKRLSKIFSDGAWPRSPISDACAEIFAGGDVPKNNHSKEPTRKHQIPIYTNGEKNKGLYGYTDVARVTEPSLTISARGTIGYTEIRCEGYYPAIRLIVVVPDKNVLDLRYLFYAVRITDINHSGTSIPQLTVPMVREFTIPLPPVAEQKEIAEQLDTLQEEVSRLESLYTRKLAALHELKQSLLHQAFSGQL